MSKMMLPMEQHKNGSVCIVHTVVLHDTMYYPISPIHYLGYNQTVYDIASLVTSRIYVELRRFEFGGRVPSLEVA